ncbi:hypothetical protein [Tabrizicola sp.]|uniref:hypothetical protein n=1 Tax=Tabrizicola sp. TaxID=2005166 RepID=UPI0035B24706
MASGFSVEPNVALRRLGSLVLVFALIGGLPIFARIIGAQFLPSTAWVSHSVWLAWGSGIFCAVFFTVMFMRNKPLVEPDMRPFMYILLIIFSPIFFGSLGKDAIVAGAPMLYTMVAGKPTELQYVVERATGFSDRKCRNDIELMDMPSMYDRLCGFPKDFRDSLRPGQTLIVSGHGSSLGTFVTSAHVAGQ